MLNDIFLSRVVCFWMPTEQFDSTLRTTVGEPWDRQHTWGHPRTINSGFVKKGDTWGGLVKKRETLGPAALVSPFSWLVLPSCLLFLDKAFVYGPWMFPRVLTTPRFSSSCPLCWAILLLGHPKPIRHLIKIYRLSHSWANMTISRKRGKNRVFL